MARLDTLAHTYTYTHAQAHMMHIGAYRIMYVHMLTHPHMHACTNTPTPSAACYTAPPSLGTCPLLCPRSPATISWGLSVRLGMEHPAGPNVSASLGGLSPWDSSLVFQSSQQAWDVGFPLKMCCSGSPLLVSICLYFMSLNPSSVSAIG